MPSRILVIRFGSLGDIILTSAAVLNLRISFPHARIYFLTKEKFRSVVGMMSGIDEVLTISDDMDFLAVSRYFLRLNDLSFDTIVDLHGNNRSWLARRLVKAEKKVVYPKRRQERLAATRRRNKLIDPSPPHTIDLYNLAVNEIGGRAIVKRPVLVPDGKLSISFPEKPYVVIAPGAAHPTKQFPSERFEKIAAGIKDKFKVRIVWALTSNMESEMNLDRSADTVLIDEPIERLAALIRSAEMLIANDSGVAHLASAVGTPVLAIFGPTHPTLGFSPRGQFDSVVQIDEFCRPCSRHGKKECYREEQFCFTVISDTMIYERAQETVERRLKRSPAIFIDRDGTLIVEKHFLSNPDEIEFERGVVEALKLAAEYGFKIVIVSNQSGVARGKFNIETVELVNNRLLEMLSREGVEVDGFYFCPHHLEGSVEEYAIRCDCRKPAAGMLEQAADELNIDLRKSYVIGDKADDFFLGWNCGAKSLMVLTGYGRKERENLWLTDSQNDSLFFENLADAVRSIKSNRVLK